MTLKRQALRTHAVSRRLAVTVWQKLPEMLSANRTFYFVPTIKRTYQNAEQTTETNQRLTRENPCK